MKPQPLKKTAHSFFKFLPGMQTPIFVFDRKNIERKEAAQNKPLPGVSNEKDSSASLPMTS